LGWEEVRGCRLSNVYMYVCRCVRVCMDVSVLVHARLCLRYVHVCASVCY
jgi:hypothetical protein